MVRWRLNCVVLMIVLACVGVAAAQDERVQLPEVVVTATRTRTHADDATSSVTVITGNEVAQRDDASVTQALRGAPGVDITEFGSAGRSAFASIRGAAPDQVLVLLDGVEVNSPNVGQFDFANLTTDNLDRIEIVRGSGGALYGSEAIGGVINVLSQRGEGPLQVSVSGEAGTAATHREVASVSGAHGAFALSGTASYNATDGFRSINDDAQNFSTNWRGDADLVPGGTLRGFVRYSDARAGLANFNVSEDRLDPDAYSRNDFFLAKGEWEHTLGNLTYRAATSFVRDNQRFRDDTVDEEGEVEPVVIGHFPTEIIGAETQVDYLWREFALSTVGLDFKERSARVYQLEAASDDTDAPVDAARLNIAPVRARRLPQRFGLSLANRAKADDDEDDAQPEIEHFNANRSNVAVYAQEQLRLLDDTLRGVGGVRYDHYDGFSDQVTWSGTGSYLLQPTRTRFRVGYAEGFRAPSFDELFEPTLGNANLQAEESWEINAGFTQDLYGGRIRFEPTYFYREVTNFIEETADQLPGPIAGVPEEARARNVNARFQGVELITRAQPTRGLFLWTNYTYLNFVTATGTLLNRPRHRGAVGATGQRADLFAAGDYATAALQVYAVGRRDSADPFSEPEPFMPSKIGGYARVDLALSYQLPDRWVPLTITATVRNLFNRDYQEALGFPAPPARFLIGFRYHYRSAVT